MVSQVYWYLMVTICVHTVQAFLFHTVIPRDTKLIHSRGDFVSWNFRIMGQDLPYKWCNLLQPTKALV